MSVANQHDPQIFIPTAEDGRVANTISISVAAGASFACLTVIGLSWIIWRDQRTRVHIDRLSYKLLLTCIACAIPLEAAYIVTTIQFEHGEVSICRASMWFTTFFYSAMNILMGCISLNLALALFWRSLFYHPLVRWYLGVTLLASIVIASVPLGLDGYKWNPSLRSCWYAQSDSAINPYEAALIYAPLLVITIIMIVSTAAVAYKLLCSRARRSAAQLLQQLYSPFSTLTMSTNPAAFPPQTPGLEQDTLATITSHFNHDNTEVRIARLPMMPAGQKNQYVSDQAELRRTVFRVSIYPITHVFLAFFGVFGQILLALTPNADTSYQRRLYIQQFIWPAIIPLAYAVCAVFADPGLLRGIRELFRLYRGEEEFEEALFSGSGTVGSSCSLAGGLASPPASCRGGAGGSGGGAGGGRQSPASTTGRTTNSFLRIDGQFIRSFPIGPSPLPHPRPHPLSHPRAHSDSPLKSQSQFPANPRLRSPSLVEYSREKERDSEELKMHEVGDFKDLIPEMDKEKAQHPPTIKI